MATYDSWLQDYDGWLQGQPLVEYEVDYDDDEKVYFVLEDGKVYPHETFNTEEDAQTFIKWLLGE